MGRASRRRRDRRRARLQLDPIALAHGRAVYDATLEYFSALRASDCPELVPIPSCLAEAMCDDLDDGADDLDESDSPGVPL